MDKGLDRAANVVVIAIAVAFGWTQLRGGSTLGRVTPSAAPISIETAETDGSPAAKVGVIEYSDFECPFCIAFSRDTLPRIRQAFVATGSVVLAFVPFPLASIHPNALLAAESAECAGAQRKFWPMHDLEFRQPAALDQPHLRADAAELGLNEQAFVDCLGAGRVASEILAGIEQGRAAGVSSTPTFLIGPVVAAGRVKVRTVLTGARPFEEFEKAIRDSLGH